MAITKRQAYLITVLTTEAISSLGKALNVAEHTEDIRFVANVRSRHEEVLKLHDEVYKTYLELEDDES